MVFEQFLKCVGAYVFCLYIIDSVWSVVELIKSYLMQYFNRGDGPLWEKYGQWAVVTGCTDGIGKYYALELAKKNINIVLVSRNPVKLQHVAQEIEKYGVKTKIIVADFSEGPKIYQHIEEELKGIDVGILVNNVGVANEYPMPLCEMPPSKVWEMVHVNVLAVSSMCRMLLPGMVARGRGAVVNMSSASEMQYMPLLSVYAASKVYTRSFTHAIREEYAPHGIYVQHLSPFFISTNMISNFSKRLMEGNLFVPDAEKYARSAVNLLGRVHNTTGFWIHGIMYTICKLAPEWVRMHLGNVLTYNFRREYMINNVTKLK
ncbi:unnamed protein product [Leptidea sinapis]|uniref:Inactive hydroxysteroid dehydrogenase-like protein 1 n=1 Tax=Leptidea sinapis TaxID=189913 RepID=A0A5E4R701_9NEOP|nr:unnamed protein product [Leptidea sinapis]